MSAPFFISLPSCTRVCLNIAFCQLCVPLCGRFAPNERGAVGCDKLIWGKYTAKWGVQMAGMNVQTRSKARPAFTHLKCKEGNTYCAALPTFYMKYLLYRLSQTPSRAFPYCQTIIKMSRTISRVMS